MRGKNGRTANYWQSDACCCSDAVVAQACQSMDEPAIVQPDENLLARYPVRLSVDAFGIVEQAANPQLAISNRIRTFIGICLCWTSCEVCSDPGDLQK